MSKGNARVSGTAPTYYAVDGLDECPNTPDMPYPVSQWKYTLIAKSERTASVGLGRWQEAATPANKRRRHLSAAAREPPVVSSTPLTWAASPVVYCISCDTSARIRDEYRTLELSDDKNMKRVGVYLTWAEPFN
jgi:hypothetical protein